MKTTLEWVGLSQQALRFLGIAGGITLFDWTTFMLLCLLIAPSIAFVISFAVAVTIRFWLDRKFTFIVTKGNWRWQLIRYFLSCLITFSVSFIAFQTARHFGVQQLPAKVFSTGCGTIFGFVLFKCFVFAQVLISTGSSSERQAES
jgi:putative flippase GtrA